MSYRSTKADTQPHVDLRDFKHPGQLIIVASSVGGGKCLSGDDEIFCADGTVTTVRYAFEHGLLPRVISISADFKLCHDQVIAIQSNGYKNVYCLKTADGCAIKLTSNHPVLTSAGWRPVAQLVKGDRIALPRKLPIISGSIALQESALKIIAYMLSEGTLRAQSPIFTNSNSILVRDMDTALREHGLKLSRHGRTSMIDFNIIQLNRKETPFGKNIGLGYRKGVLQFKYGHWRHFCKIHDLHMARSRDKHIPAEIFQISNEQLCLFLSRMFAGDGMAYWKKCHGERWSGEYRVPKIGYASMSLRMLKQIKSLLLRLEIKSSIRSNERELYLRTSEDRLRFIEQVGIFGREEILREFKTFLISNSNRGRRTLDIGDNIPSRTPHVSSYSRIDGRTTWFAHTYVQNQSRSNVLLAAQVLSDPKLHELATSDIFWSHIQDVKYVGVEETFDVQVRDNHNLVIDGVIVHNTTLLEWFGKAYHQGRQDIWIKDPAIARQEDPSIQDYHIHLQIPQEVVVVRDPGAHAWLRLADTEKLTLYVPRGAVFKPKVGPYERGPLHMENITIEEFDFEELEDTLFKRFKGKSAYESIHVIEFDDYVRTNLPKRSQGWRKIILGWGVYKERGDRDTPVCFIADEWQQISRAQRGGSQQKTLVAESEVITDEITSTYRKYKIRVILSSNKLNALHEGLRSQAAYYMFKAMQLVDHTPSTRKVAKLTESCGVDECVILKIGKSFGYNRIPVHAIPSDSSIVMDQLTPPPEGFLLEGEIADSERNSKKSLGHVYRMLIELQKTKTNLDIAHMGGWKGSQDVSIYISRLRTICGIEKPSKLSKQQKLDKPEAKQPSTEVIPQVSSVEPKVLEKTKPKMEDMLSIFASADET